jgi:hypothetical protein
MKAKEKTEAGDKTVSIGSFPIMPVSPDDDRLRTKVSDADIDAWMRKLYALAKIGTVDFRRADNPNGAMGLIGVPAKYVAVIDAMHMAMTALACGEPLPEFAEPEPTPARKRKPLAMSAPGEE